MKKGGASSITLKLAPSLVVSSVSSPNFGRLLALRIAGQNNILVPLPSFVMEDTDLVIDVSYSGRLDPQQLDREAIAVDGQVPVSQDPTALTPVLEPEKRYLYSSRSLWYPQGQGTDYATASLRLSVPSQYQLVASGSLVGRQGHRGEGRGGARRHPNGAHGRVLGRSAGAVSRVPHQPVRAGRAAAGGGAGRRAGRGDRRRAA